MLGFVYWLSLLHDDYPLLHVKSPNASCSLYSESRNTLSGYVEKKGTRVLVIFVFFAHYNTTILLTAVVSVVISLLICKWQQNFSFVLPFFTLLYVLVALDIEYRLLTFSGTKQKQKRARIRGATNHKHAHAGLKRACHLPSLAEHGSSCLLPPCNCVVVRRDSS